MTMSRNETPGAISSNGFGTERVTSPRRVPIPPTRMQAWRIGSGIDQRPRRSVIYQRPAPPTDWEGGLFKPKFHLILTDVYHPILAATIRAGNSRPPPVSR